MKLKFLFSRAEGIKKWLVSLVIGIIIVISCCIAIGYHADDNVLAVGLYAVAVFFGLLLCVVSIKASLKCIVRLINRLNNNILDSKKLEKELCESAEISKGPRVVLIGGGTGLSNLLRGMKKFTCNITAIVTVGDDGGGSGILRQDLDMIPPGDIRNCILALANTEPIMEELLEYRFTEGRLKGQSFGNLFLAAMDGISENFMEAVKKVSSVLAVKGNVLPVTMKKITLKAKLENGNMVEGESNIPKEASEQNSPIKKMYIEPSDARGLREAVLAIKEADAIIMGPGSLYTSIMPNLLVNDIRKEIHKSVATKIYISNIMTQHGETDNFTVKDHVKIIQDHCGKEIIDYVIANNGSISEELEKKYYSEEAKLVELNKEEVEKLGVKLIEDNLIKVKDNFIRHDTYRICEIIVNDIMKKELCLHEKKRLQDIKQQLDLTKK
ncbi:conserved hypothetical protein, cofD-related [Hathewaya proteolytica DSM 3090]|uniref:Putative gluconeogenesis factor n=1 Tax=Hathewaya proteolytica DSM 3090 TaxID=1121331 RepID=A0A1M6NGM4_9CLOT|nr:gluconeogenesis factor YvcK family protein [Hathewaya proteolytica]SHJ94829.1 conserved hypothetical protein, cofD-related [Hathewaya proteolytica DSM 3090]